MTRQGERVAVLALLVAIFIVIGMLYLQERRVAKAMLLNYQLQALRTSVNLYKAIEKRNPLSLQELFEGKFRFPGNEKDRSFATCPRLGKEGECLDPFGHVFTYDKSSGWVGSSTPRYKNW